MDPFKIDKELKQIERLYKRGLLTQAEAERRFTNLMVGPIKELFDKEKAGILTELEKELLDIVRDWPVH
jgi:hypothetical protein